MKINKEFRILSYEEEKKLNDEELKNYYQCLKDYLTKKNFNAFKRLYIKICEKLNEKLVRKVINRKINYILEVRGQENIPEGPVIFASTHQHYDDHYNVVLSIPKHAIILNTKNVTFLFKLIMSVNGIVYVDRKSKKSRFKSKLSLMKYLAKNKSIVIFPEATFNCSPNKLLLPFHKGVVDIAKKMQVPIVPMVQEYTYNPLDPTINNVEKSIVSFGKPIYVSYDDVLDDKLEELEESIATTRWDLINEKGTFDKLSLEEYENSVKARIDGWSKINVSIDDERKMIYGIEDEFYLFNHANDVPFENGEFLQPEECRRLEKINDAKLANIVLDRNGEIIDINEVLRLTRNKK